MSEQVKSSAMRKKAGEGRPPPEIMPASATGLLRSAVIHAASDTLGMTLAVSGLNESRVVLTALADMFEEQMLVALIEGPDSSFGIVAADVALSSALVEYQTTGRVAPTQSASRAPTRTDAILCADFLDAVLEQFETRVTEAQVPVAAAVSGFRFAVPLDDADAIALALEDTAYRVFQLELEIEGGVKQGKLLLVMPFNPPTPNKPLTCNEDDGMFAIAHRVMDAEAKMTAVLYRAQLTLEEVMQLVPGMTLPVPRKTVGTVGLEDICGNIVSRCRLGHSDGFRALRIGAREQPNAIDPGLIDTAGIAQVPDLPVLDSHAMPPDNLNPDTGLPGQHLPEIASRRPEDNLGLPSSDQSAGLSDLEDML